MTSCRGILIAGVTNRARTKMAEGILTSLTCQRVFVKSGGYRHDGFVHPLAADVMEELGIDIRGRAASSLESAQRQRRTYDVYISIDDAYVNKHSDKYQRGFNSKVLEEEEASARSSSSSSGSGSAAHPHGFSDPLLAPAMPSHWSIAADATDARQRWTLWSPRDPSIYHETSTRKFQDDLYEGEPLFMQPQFSLLRQNAKVSERWEVPEVAESFAMEREVEHRERFIKVRDELCGRCVALLRRLEDYYGEDLMVNQELLDRLNTKKWVSEA